MFRYAFFVVLAALVLKPVGLSAAESLKKNFNVPAGDAQTTLREFSRQAGVQLIYDVDKVNGVRTSALQGTFTAHDALGKMLKGTRLTVAQDEKTGALTVRWRLDPNVPGAAATTSSRPGQVDGAGGGYATIEGRIYSPATDEYLGLARVTVEGTSIEAFSDADGDFRLSVPAGEVRLRVFYTGFPAQSVALNASAGVTIVQNFNLTTAGETGDRTVKMGNFVVTASKEMSGAAIAINEQRFAPNIKTVVATDELGYVPEGSIAEFVKFMPGVTTRSSGISGRDISINGVPTEYVPVTVDGFNLASAQPGGGTTRSSHAALPANSFSRVEVTYSPTPDSPGGALAGLVNVVSRSSFERSKPVFDARAYISMRSDARSFEKEPGGASRGPNQQANPGFEFTYVRPVNARFGFTIGGGASNIFQKQGSVQLVWRGASGVTNGAAFPNTTPDRPYLSTFVLIDNPSESQRYNFDFTVDYKLTPHDRLSLSFHYNNLNSANMSRQLQFNIMRVAPGGFSPSFTQGATGTGAGTLLMSNVGQTRDNRLYMPTLVWKHTGTVWQADAGLAHSHARNVVRNIDRGFFNNVAAQRQNVTIAFADNTYTRPGSITVTDSVTGAPIDPFVLRSYDVATATGRTQYGKDLQRTAYTNVRREFRGPVPFSLKAGLDVRQSVRDLRDFAPSFTFAAANRNAAQFLDPVASQPRAPYGFPRIERVSNWALWDYWQTNPGQFTSNANNDYRATVTSSKLAQEVVSSGFIRGDLPLLEGKLKLIGGVRAEQTNVDAEGPLSDPSRNFQRDTSGNVLRAANGTPLPIMPASNALGVSQLTYLERGSTTKKEYLRWFPSLNASYNVRENLVARAAHYWSIGRPDFDQYTGGITLPNITDIPGLTNRIVVNNGGIKAWSAKTTSVRLEYYFAGVGQVSLGAFRRDLKNFFGTTVFRPSPEFLALYGLSPSIYENYDVSTQENIPGTVRMTGVNASYKQTLTFLPPWARGMQIFANVNVQRTQGGAGTEDLAGFVPRSGNWGISLNREKYNVRANWAYRGRQRNAAVVGNGIESGTFNWTVGKTTLDVSGEYQVWKRIYLFASLRNATVVPEEENVEGPNTPPIARLRRGTRFGALWTFGIRGTF